MLYRISVTERGLTGIANIFRSRLSRLDDLLGAGTVPLMTSNPHTKFEHNRPSRFRDTEARCGGISARAHVQRYPTRDYCISCN